MRLVCQRRVLTKLLLISPGKTTFAVENSLQTARHSYSEVTVFVLVTLMIMTKIKGVKTQASRATIQPGFLTYQGGSWPWRSGFLTALI